MFKTSVITQRAGCCPTPEPSPIGIEQGAVPIGCVKDDDGNVIGSVEKVITYNEDGTFNQSLIEATMFGPPASTVSPYEGEIWDCNEKSFTTQKDYVHRETCEIHTLVRCYENGKITRTFMENPDGTITEEGDIDMSDMDFATSEGNEKKTLEAEIEFFALAGEFSGTIEDAVGAALAATPVNFTAPDGTEIVATAEHLCAYKVNAAPCDTNVLTDPLDPASGVPVTADGTYVNGVQIRGDADSPFAEANATAPVAQVADAFSTWCFQFKLEGECDKAGNFTAAGAAVK